MAFLTPWLLGGLALASAPLIIHLLNRRRFTVVDWAPMRYLKLTLKTNRRRLRLEQWLLLAIRTLAVIALFLAVARPVMSSTGLGALLGGQGRTSRVLVIDDSLSMGARTGGRSAMDRAKEAGGKLIQRVGTKDSVTIITSTQPDQPLIRDAHIDEPKKVIKQVDDLETTDAAATWSAILPSIDEHLKASAYPVKTVTLVSDLQAQGWSDQVRQQAKAWDKQGVQLQVIDVGASVPANAAITKLTRANRPALVGAPVPISAKIHLTGSKPPAGNQAIVKIDGQPRPIELPDLEPGKTSELTLSPKFDDPGEHTVQLTLPEDALISDNQRWLSVEVKDHLNITLVDGEPASGPFASETDFLKLATSVGQAPWRVKNLVDSQWLAQGGPANDAPDVLVLANVSSIPAPRAASLERRVKAGMGLMIFVGRQIDPAAYNDTLSQAGQPLLPARLDAIVQSKVSGLLVDTLDDSPLNALTKLNAAALADISPRQVMSVKMPQTKSESSASANGAGSISAGDFGASSGLTGSADASDSAHVAPVRVLARWNDAARHPAVIERRVGNGRVLLWTITADKAWSDWPTQPSYVLAVRRCVTAIAGMSQATRTNLTAGSAITQPADPERPPTKASVTPPGQASDKLASITRPRDKDKPPLIRFDQTDRAGLYTLTWDVPGAQDRTRRFAVNPDASESDLQPIDHAQLSDLFKPLPVEIIRFGQDAASSADRIELWRTLAMCLLGLVLVETLVATYVGRER